MAVTRIKNNQITDATVVANAKLVDYSISSAKLANNLTYDSNLTITGNLTVQGNATAIDTTITTIEDPVIVLASTQTSGAPAVDIGFLGYRGNESNIAFVWDESADEFVTAFTSTGETNTTISITSYADFHTNNANIGGNLIVGGNISITGNVASLNVTGNITGGNLLTPGVLSAAGNATGGNVLTGGAVSATANVTGGNLLTGGLISATSTITSAANITGGNILTGGLISATATITGGNLATGGTVSATANITGGNVLTGGLISATSTITSAANITGGNVLTGGLISATSTITSAANITGGNILTGGLISATSTITSAANITGGNLLTGGLISATSTITSASNITGSNILTAGIVSAGGNVIADNVVTDNVVSTGSITISTAANGAINLSPNGTGNVVLSNTYINGLVLNPVQDQDAATKYYVDNLVTTAISYHEAVVAATTGNLDAATGGTVTYNQPNGAANGVGATLTTTGSFTTIDTANVQTVGTRILVKDQANAVQNGVYVYSNATVITRASTEDTYGPASANTFSINDYFFVTSGNVNAGSAWIVDSPAGTITFGTSNILFAQFSQSQVYSANTSAGLSLIGTVFSAKVDNNTTAFDLNGNISVKAGANLTTPNIGAATGTSLSVTGAVNAGTTMSAAGNITGGNLLTGGLISATSTITSAANITGGNLLTGGLISATSTITSAANITGGNLLTGGLVTATGNVTGGNITTGGLVTATGNITGGNLLTGGLISATSTITSAANITGGNVLTGGLISATSTITSAANITGGNLLTGGLISATSTITSAANITGGNVLTGGLITATGNITGANLILTTGIIDGPAAGRITINGSDIDTDFAVDGDTLANVFYVDAGTGTASFGSSTQVTNAIVNFAVTTSIKTPVGNTAQRPATGVTGMLRFNSTTNSLEIYDNTEWTTVGVPAFTVIADEQFNGDGSTVTFTLGSSQTTNSCIVSINGVVQIPTSAYSVSTTTLTFTEAPLSGDLIDVREITTTTTVTAISNTSGNAVVEVLDSADTVQITGNLLPLTANSKSLGSSSKPWQSLYVAGNTIYLGTLQLKQTDASTFTVYKADGVTQANIDVGNVDVSSIVSGTSTIGIYGTGQAYMTVNGNANVLLASNTSVLVNGAFSATGNITGNYILGNGSQLTGIDATSIQSGTSNVRVVSSGGNVTVGVGGTANVAVFSTDGLTLGSGNLTVGNIVNSGSNGVGNIGSSTTYFNTVFAKATSAQYADLAEKYTADATYEPGTVVMFGGTAEVTLCINDGCSRVAGVISTNPSYIMNGTLNATHVATVALTGRVPTRVTGIVRKGDLMVSAGNGTARAEPDPKVGTVIGKALADSEGDAIIEVVVGRV